MMLALPLMVPWNTVPSMWVSFLGNPQGFGGQMLTVLGFDFDYKFNAVHTWILIVAMDTWHWIGLVVILCYSNLSTISPAYYQSAAIDGASRFQVFRFIELPKMGGVLLMALLLRFMDSFMIYTEVFRVNAGGPDHTTSFLSLDLGEEIAAYDYGPAAARSTAPGWPRAPDRCAGTAPAPAHMPRWWRSTRTAAWPTGRPRVR